MKLRRVEYADDPGRRPCRPRLSTRWSTATNRLTGAGAGYDAGGNLTDLTIGGETYEYTYDPLNMMKYLQSDTAQARVFLYDADDERIMTFDCAFVDGDCAVHAQQTTTIRGLDGKVLRIYNQPFGGAWNWERDYVYRDGQLLASVEPAAGGGEDTVHFHLDHLGSPRQITDEGATEVAFHTYYPFGGEATVPSQDGVELKFTGHERDDNGGAGAGVLDYMHARYYSPRLGRFLSVDPANSATTKASQSWNRNTYVRNSPLAFVDLDGEDLSLVFDFSAVSDQLPPRQRSTIMQQTRAIFTEARVNNVRVFTKGQKIPSVKGKHHVTTLKFEKIVKKADGSPVLGKTNAFMDTTPFQPNKGHVSTTRGGLQGDAMLIQLSKLSNTSGHEIGHTLGLYPFDGVGSETPAPAGSVMETGVPASALGQELRYFSAEEAEYLRDLLNEPGETAFYFSHEGN